MVGCSLDWVLVCFRRSSGAVFTPAGWRKRAAGIGVKSPHTGLHKKMGMAFALVSERAALAGGGLVANSPISRPKSAPLPENLSVKRVPPFFPGGFPASGRLVFSPFRAAGRRPELLQLYAHSEIRVLSGSRPAFLRHPSCSGHKARYV